MKRMPRAKAGSGETADVVQNVMDVDRLFRERPLVAEDFHAIHEIPDTVGLGADQLGQRAIFVGQGRLEKLRRTADARQRVLDFVSEDRGHAGDGARGGAMGELSLNHLRHVALLDHEQDVPSALGEWPGVDIDEFGHQEFRRMHFDAVLVDGRTAAADLIEQGEQWAAEC